MKRIKRWLTVTRTLARTGAGATLVACGGGVPSSPAVDGGAGARPAPDAETVEAAPCAGRDILMQVDAAASPRWAACQACLADPASTVPAPIGGTCLEALAACSDDCACDDAALAIADCLDDGGTGASCLEAQELMPGPAGSVPFNTLVTCEEGPCRIACLGSAVVDGGDAAEPEDAGHGAQAIDGSSEDAITDGASADARIFDATVDAAGLDANLLDVASDASMNDSTDSAARERCDEAGHCTCFNIASLGYGGATGAQLGSATGGTDNTEALVNYLNTQSSAEVAQLGCGTDIGCTSPAKPTLNAAFLAQYDVLIFQWMTNGEQLVDANGNPVAAGSAAAAGFKGNGYWSFTQDELTALNTWVTNGGGMIVLSWYDYSAGEINPANQILGAVSSIQYTSEDTFGTVLTGNAAYCLGDTDPVTVWAQAPDILGENITEVGAFHGRGITAPSPAVVDCNNAIFGVCAAHQDVGSGHVYAYTDEWITYTSQWNPAVQPAGYCSLDGSTANGDSPAVQFAYQVPQFWYNAIRYAAQATTCPFTLTGAIAR